MEELEEKPQDRAEEVRRWFKELELADKAEKDWKTDARAAIKAYESECDGENSKRTFNIFWSNVEIKRQAIYSALPDPDIRRRWRDEDKVGLAAARVLERCSSYILDCKDVDSDLISAVNDCLVPGRAITRLKLKTTFNDDKSVKSQSLETEQVQWDKFKKGPGKNWSEVPWVSFSHDLHKDEVEARWGKEIADKLSYKAVASGEEKEEEVQTVFSKTRLHEIWDKETRTVKWVAESWKDDFLSVDEDPLDLRNFWPIPKPLYAIESSTSLDPETEYSKYQVLADELEIVTRRRNKIASAMRVRGVYDSTLTEMEDVLAAGDNKLIPAEGASKFAEMGKGLDNAIWMLPLKELAEVYSVLGQQRNELIGQIYEITGISDIVRGDTNPNETATAQKIKGNFASLRLEKQKTAFQKYSRDLVRLIVEVIAEKFDRSTLQRMSGLKFPTQEDMMQAQMAVQRFQMMQGPQQPNQPPQEPPPQIQQAQELLQSGMPTWEEIEQVMQDDLERDYRIDIETDSTIAIDKQRDQQNMAEFITAMGNFTKAIGEAGGIGMLSPEAGKKMFVMLARRFEMGREVEDELEKQQPQKEGPSPEEIKAKSEQQKMEMEQQSDQMKAELEKQMAQIKAESKQREAELNQREAVMDFRLKQMEARVEAERLQNKNAYEEKSHQRKMETLDKQNASAQ